MPKGHPALSEIQKKEIVARVSENGERVPDLAKEFNVHSKTIYNLLGRQANKAGALIELAKVKRENEALLTIIGSLVAESKLGKKKPGKK
ncbi:MAG: hypothetical protein EBT45_08005 [Alphaproteobacteria bacterium]|jgi:hypothetical protein|nr:hypothetical protein [Alphaproteobacteria bacterium]